MPFGLPCICLHMPLGPRGHPLRGGTPLWHMPAYAIGPFLAYACICHWSLPCICLHMPLGPGPQGPPPQGGGAPLWHMPAYASTGHPCGICQHMPATALASICWHMLAYAMGPQVPLAMVFSLSCGGGLAYACICYNMPCMVWLTYAGICWHMQVFFCPHKLHVPTCS